MSTAPWKARRYNPTRGTARSNGKPYNLDNEPVEDGNNVSARWRAIIKRAAHPG